MKKTFFQKLFGKDENEDAKNKGAQEKDNKEQKKLVVMCRPYGAHFSFPFFPTIMTPLRGSFCNICCLQQYRHYAALIT